MDATPGPAEWFYVGHYGQLGPLTLGQVTELAQDGVIGADTFVWKAGMADWLPASQIADVRIHVVPAAPEFAPPPPPGTTLQTSPAAPPTFSPGRSYLPASAYGSLDTVAPQSSKSRISAGILNLIPGVGRFYLGYYAHGTLQFVTTIFCGVGILWSIIDGIYILMGGVKYDGYGQVLRD